MIRYALNCKKGHEFEAWFRSSADYDEQRSKKLVQCPSCATTNVEKAIMAPNINLGKNSRAPGAHEVDGEHAPSAQSQSQHEQRLHRDPASETDNQATSQTPTDPTPRALEPQVEQTEQTEQTEQAEMHGLNLPNPKEMLEAIRQYRAHIEENAENVGDKFADEARKIHYEEEPSRSIYGNATPDEVEELIEEGVEIAPIPGLPEDKN